MTTIRIRDSLADRILVSRESARVLENAIGALIVGSSALGNDQDLGSYTIDFEGVEGVAPSFIDELIRVFESVLTQVRGNGHDWRLIVENPPNRLSSKFEAIARSHAMSIDEQPDGSWIFAGAQATDA